MVEGYRMIFYGMKKGEIREYYENVYDWYSIWSGLKEAVVVAVTGVFSQEIVPNNKNSGQEAIWL